MRILDQKGEEIAKMRQLQSCNFPVCCKDVFGLIISDSSTGRDKYILKNTYCQAQCCEKCDSSCCCPNLYLYIHDAETDQQVGIVTKKWTSVARECCTNADTIIIEFPSKATPEDKAALIGATLLADYNLWEYDGE